MSLPRPLAGDSRVHLRCPQLVQKERGHPVSDSSSGTLSWSLHEDTWTQMKFCRPHPERSRHRAAYSESWRREPEHDVIEMGRISEWQTQEVALRLLSFLLPPPFHSCPPFLPPHHLLSSTPVSTPLDLCLSSKCTS